VSLRSRCWLSVPDAVLTWFSKSMLLFRQLFSQPWCWHSALHLPFTCPSPALHLPVTCPSPALHLPITCHSLALHLPITCPSPAPHTPFTCPLHALHLPFTCLSHALHLPFTCLSHRLPFTCMCPGCPCMPSVAGVSSEEAPAMTVDAGFQFPLSMHANIHLSNLLP